MNRQRRRALRPTLDCLDDRCLLSVLLPSQVTRAYGLDAIAFAANGQTVKGDGSGQTIAIIDVDHDPFLASDLQAYDQANNLPDPSLAQVNLAGSQTDDGWAEEEAMDVEWAHAIAPGAKIVVVEAASASTQDLLTAVDVARSVPGVSVISMSWGGNEFKGQVGLDAHFTTPAGHTGITFVASSGDGGSGSGAQWPASSPNVVAVGGTTLQVGASGAYLGESIWYGSGSGTSRFESEPSYQRSLQSTGRRTTPDVAFVADPYTGVAVYDTAPSTGVATWQTVGGTSVGAPAWAGIIAIADQGRALNGAGSLDGRSQTLPLLYSLPSSDFHKVASVGGQSAGLGTPVGASLVNGLASGVLPAIRTTVSARSHIKRVARKSAVALTPIQAHTTTPPARGAATSGTRDVATVAAAVLQMTRYSAGFSPRRADPVMS